MQVIIKDRVSELNPLVNNWKVKRLYWALPGGCREAKLEAHSKDIRDNLEQILDGLGKSVDILDDFGQNIWNGFVNEIEIQLGSTAMRVSLDQFANRVAIRYIDLKPSAPWSKEDGITNFVEDQIMVQRFGKKEWMGFLPNGTPGQALNAAQTWLKEKTNFKKKLVLGEIETNRVIYHLKGWWETLDWIFYKQDAGFIGHLDEGKTVCEIGISSALQKVAQKFIAPAGGIKTSEVWLRLSKKLEPNDNILVEIVADFGGSPGTSVLASGLIAGNELTGGYNWKRFGVGSVNLVPGGTYWLVVRRSGGVSSVNYFLVATDDALGYAAGEVKTWNGSSWAIRNEDLNFAILGSEETSKQMERIINFGGQFLNGIRIRDASGLEYLLWRELNLTCREELLNLLQVGTVDGSKLDAIVDAERYLVVWRRKEVAEWKMDSRGRLRTIVGGEWNPGMDWLGGLAETEFGEVVRLEEWEWWR